jgi:hypothetical protein
MDTVEINKMIERRIFVVGCSRSGTTLLQVLLASHPEIKSFPETNFFWSSVGGSRRRILARLGLTTGLEPGVIRDTLDLLDDGRGEEYEVPSFFFTFRSAVSKYKDILDSEAKREGKRGWLEKTPLHLFRIEFIEPYIENASFVHIVRDGRDVVASIRHRAKEYPDEFGWQKDPSYGIDLWNQSLQESLRHVGKRNHVFTTYKRITERTKKEMRRLAGSLDIEYDSRMEEGDPDTRESVIPDRKRWIHNAKREPKKRHLEKYDRLFSESEKDKIEEGLRMDLFESIKDFVSDAS